MPEQEYELVEAYSLTVYCCDRNGKLTTDFVDETLLFIAR